MSLPAGYTIDSTRLPAAFGSQGATLGRVQAQNVATSGQYDAQSSAFAASSTQIGFIDPLNATVTYRISDLNVARTIDFTGELIVPIAEWAGAPNYAGSNDVEYASNSSTSSSDDTTSFAYGPQGSLVPTITASAAATVIEKRVRFLTPFQAGEAPLVLYQKGGTGPFVPIDTSYDYMNTLQNTGAAARYYGISARSVNSTDVSIYFGSAGSKPTGTTYGAVGANFPANASDRYMVVKARAGAAVGFGAATQDRLGLVKAGQVPGSLTTIGTGYIGETIALSVPSSAGTSTAGTAISIGSSSFTLSQGVWEVSYNMGVAVLTGTAGSARNTGAMIVLYNTTAGATVGDSQSFTYMIGQPINAANYAQLAKSVVLIVSNSTSYELRLSCNQTNSTTGATANVFTGSITTGISSTSYLVAKRIG
jgi:hypothetical protein